jgi:peptidoglycan/xylan/chitin deacetylase (PgdA/CDA1 family)
MRTALNLAGGALWYMPGCFRLARVLDPRYSLRCVLFHNVSDAESPFTKGLGVTISRSNFEAALRFLVRHYTPVRLEDVLTDCHGRGLPSRPVLVTFDDAYASVCEFAAPLCHQLGVPAISFVNAACLDNRQLALDNLVCHVANVLGMGTINAAARAVNGTQDLELGSLTEVFTRFLPTISLRDRDVFREALVRIAELRECEFAAEAKLYMTSQQVRDLALLDFEIGNHTYSHVHCRCLSKDDLGSEIDRSKTALEAICGKTVRSFSVPYGSSADLTTDVAVHLRLSGHEVVFLSESVANREASSALHLDRISSHGDSDEALFLEIEVLPRLRAMRNRILRRRHEGLHGGQQSAGSQAIHGE